MRIAYNWSSIVIRSWESKAELQAFMKRFQGGLIIGESAEQEVEFYSAAVIMEFGNEPAQFVIGICSEGHGVIPQLLSLPSQRLCLFGVNSEIVAINTDNQQIAYRAKLEFLFRAMIELPEVGLVLILHETGAKAIRLDGAEAWSFSKDVLEDVRLDGSKIRFSFMDSAPLTLDVVSGQEVVERRS